jgi:hypothetical protein
VLLLIASATSTSASASPPAFIKQLLNAHNSERADVGVMPLVWDEGLASEAQAYAAELARSGHWEHSPADKRLGQGENLWRGSSKAFAPEAMVAEWASEKRMFRAGVFPEVSRNGKWEDVGHYTQMIWPTTVRLGCGVKSTSQWDYLVCRYSTPGNVAGDRVGAEQIAQR